MLDTSNGPNSRCNTDCSSQFEAANELRLEPCVSLLISFRIQRIKAWFIPKCQQKQFSRITKRSQAVTKGNNSRTNSMLRKKIKDGRLGWSPWPCINHGSHQSQSEEKSINLVNLRVALFTPAYLPVGDALYVLPATCHSATSPPTLKISKRKGIDSFSPNGAAIVPLFPFQIPCHHYYSGYNVKVFPWHQQVKHWHSTGFIYNLLDWFRSFPVRHWKTQWIRVYFFTHPRYIHPRYIHPGKMQPGKM